MIYFTWDMEKSATDMAIAFPIDNLESVDEDEFSLVEIPETKAVMMVLEGSYEGLSAAHMNTSKQLIDSGYAYSSDAVAIEEYVVDSMHESDPDKLRTNIYHLYK